MTADERLALVRLKIRRADKHIDELKVALVSFFESNPYKVATKRDPETQRLIYYVASAEPVPPTFAIIAGDIFHCLRDALDHLAQQLYLVGSGGGRYRDKTGFLIASSAQAFKKGRADKLDGMRQEAIDAICALEPYPGGRGADLWTLHRLNNVDKHRLILTVGSAFRSLNFGAYMEAQMEKAFGRAIPLPELFLRADPLPLLEPGHELFAATPDAEPIEKMQFRFDVALHEPGILHAKPLLETAVKFRDRVNSIIQDFRPFLS
jgi:hypothetical protein